MAGHTETGRPDPLIARSANETDYRPAVNRDEPGIKAAAGVFAPRDFVGLSVGIRGWIDTHAAVDWPWCLWWGD